MDKSYKIVSVDGSLKKQRRENIFPVSGLDSALIVDFAKKKKMPELIYM